MRKLSAISFLLGALFVILPVFISPIHIAHAALPDNHFGCVWSNGNCVLGETNCNDGFITSEQLCNAIDAGENDCTSAQFGCRNDGQEDEPTQIPIGLSQKIQNLYTWAVSLAGLVALGLIIYGGVVYASSAGNPSRITEAKAWITHALLGLFMLLGAYLILGFINPDLTKLDEVFLAQNVNPQSQVIELGANVPEECIIYGQKAQNQMLAATEGNTNCSGRYYTTAVPVAGYSTEVFQARAGNFGDIAFGGYSSCDRVGEDGDTIWNRIVRMAEFEGGLASIITNELKTYEPLNGNEACDVCCDSQVKTLRVKMTGVLADCESGGKNPNATRFPWDPGELVPQCTGAWGLFQMGLDGSPFQNGDFDIGNVHWSEQARYATHYLMTKGKPNPGEIFDCWKSNNLGPFSDFLGVCKCLETEDNWCQISDYCNPPVEDENGDLHKKTAREICGS